MADVSLKGADDMLGIEVPKLDSCVVRCRQDGPASGVKPGTVDPVAMALEAERLLRVKVEDLDRLIHRAACEQLSFKVHTDDAVCMPLECRDAFAHVPVPDFDRVYKVSGHLTFVVSS